MELSTQSCVPCRKHTPKLSPEEIANYLTKLPFWEHNPERNYLHRNLRFPNFQEALAFVNRVAIIAEQENHHPDIHFGWGYVEIILQTHAIGGLHLNDFILAAKINALA